MRLLFWLLICAVCTGCTWAQASTDLTPFVSGYDGLVASESTNGLRGAVFIGNHNNDTFADFAIGGRGIVVVLFGRPGPWAKVDLSTFVSGVDGYKIVTSNVGSLGSSVGAAGDVNQDGLDDLLVGDPLYSAPDRANCGAAHVIFGAASPGADLSVNNLLAAGQGFTIIGPSTNAFIGRDAGSVRGNAGDINNDGFNDILVSFPTYIPNTGCVWIVKGCGSNYTNVDLANLGTSGFLLTGSNGQGFFGVSMAAAGDVNGDGIADVIIGEPHGLGPMSLSAAGRAYLMLGSSSFTDKDMSTFATGSAGVRFLGPMSQIYAGSAVLGAGDVNGDGFDDIAIGVLSYINISPYRTVGQRVFVLYGAAVLPSADVVLALPFSTLGMMGFTVYNPLPFNGFSKQLNKAGDINNDGFCDILVSGDGVVYVLFGGVYTDSANIDVTNTTRVWKFSFESPVVGPPPVVSPLTLGNVISGGHDFNGDGTSDLLFGVIGQYAPTFVYMLTGPFDVVPTAAPTVLPSFAPTATPSTAPPSLVPTAAPTYVCVQWTLGEVGETCSATCAAGSLARVCKDPYFQEITTREAFESIMSAAVDVRSGGALGPVNSFCSGGIEESTDQGAARVVAYVVQDDAQNAVRRYCNYPSTASSTPLMGCNSTTSGFLNRRVCPCVHEKCDVIPWFLGSSGKSCTDTCARVGRVCDAELVSTITDNEAFSTMVAAATGVQSGAPLGTAEPLCAHTNEPQFASQYPAIVTVNTPGNINTTYCSHATTPPPTVSADDCDVEITAVPAQRFCPCKYGRKLTAVEEVVVPSNSGGSRLSKLIGALPCLRGAGV